MLTARFPILAFVTTVVCGCADSASKTPPSPDAEVPTSTPDAAMSPDSSTPPDMDPAMPVSPVTLMTRLGGLWVGPAEQTPLGHIATMPLDFRAADPDVLFARTDLDTDNALRMAVYIEQLGDTADLVFRNGGLFMGLSRDTKTALESFDDTSSSWRFCEPIGGCEYLDAVISFPADDQLIMDVKVRGQQHMLWTATRVETRELPERFPSKLDPIGSGDAEFPPMPTLEIDLTWSDPAPEGAWVWAILSDTPCTLTGTSCQASRSIASALTAGDTSATLRIDQLHAGAYHLNAVLDRDGNFQTVPFPRPGDAIIFPVDPSVTVGTDGVTTTSHAISFDVP